jgi:hypothetical protein
LALENMGILWEFCGKMMRTWLKWWENSMVFKILSMQWIYHWI